MKRFINKITVLALLTAGVISSCSLDETNYSNVDLNIAYKYKEGFDGLVNSCYENIYFLYGKLDGIGPMEMGTDSWTTVANNEAGFTRYTNNLNTETGTLKTVWQGLYSMVNLCNTAIYYSDKVVDYDETALKNKVAEAYFLRAWANFHIVEQWGNVVLNQSSMVESGAQSSAVRSDETAFYDLIISDLEYAADNLPVSQAVERGRASKKAALGMLAKAYLQRTRLGDKEKYAQLALQTAEELINNAATYECALYTSDAETSGFAKLWDGENNKKNSEFLFLEAIDLETALQPEGWNRGRTWQYFVQDNKTTAASWGMTEKSYRYSRANSRIWKPTKWLLTEAFEPKENTADTRFENTFYYKYYAYNQKAITADMASLYNKDASLVGHEISSSTMKGNTDVLKAVNYYCSIGWNNKAWEGFANMDNDQSLAVFCPNWNISDAEKSMMPCLVNDLSDMFNEDGSWTTSTYRKEIYPSLKKFSCFKYCYTEQYNMMDYPILRLGDIYLVAAEAALLYNNDKKTALKYVNAIRQRAAVTGRQDEMKVTENDMTIDFIIKERARELVGEQWRWYDLKRTGKLTKSYLEAANPDIKDFVDTKHIVRPIPISFLNTLSNPGEFGTNGY